MGRTFGTIGQTVRRVVAAVKTTGRKTGMTSASPWIIVAGFGIIVRDFRIIDGSIQKVAADTARAVLEAAEIPWNPCSVEAAPRTIAGKAADFRPQAGRYN